MPRPDEDGQYSLKVAELYLNRELTWLNFNFRVLHEAADERTPLLERVKFLAIASSNLDEFFMKRIGGLKQQVGAHVQVLTVDGRTPERQIVESHEMIRQLVERKRGIFLELLELLRAQGIELTTFDALSEPDREAVRVYYIDNVYPLVTPQSLDPAHPFPFISNLSLNLLVTLQYPEEPGHHLARVKVPVGPGVPRFLRLQGRNTFVTLESVIANNLDLLFPGMEVIACDEFRVTRNANTERSEEAADDLLALIETELRDRKFAPIVRLEVRSGMDRERRSMLSVDLGLDDVTDVVEIDGLMGMSDLMELATLQEPALRDVPHRPVDHPAFTTMRSIFHVIRESGPLLVHHPYQAFGSSVERLLEHASRDPKVRAIKMTFYRTSEDSRAIDYLVEAARNGKQVAVVMELKARFDEEANIRWAARLAGAGIHVTYGVVGLKTHCKMILVVRQDYDGLRRYVHIGTGNYHAGTARLYADVGLMTCDPRIGADLTELFNYLTTGYKPKRSYEAVQPAPKLLKRALMSRIEREIELHAKGEPGLIQFKINALEDADVTRLLYKAARTGVTVDLIVRDTCRLRPGLPGLSDTVRVISIVGRFLEHARVFYFRNGGQEEYFIGSADCMTRNLDSRVETLVPVDEPRLQAELRYLLDAQFNDRRGAWEMQADGSYVQRRPESAREGRHSQQAMIEWAERQHREATRLKRRTVQGVGRGNLDD
ncbi:MAG: polyphosphate kinase 1 [Gemmatimonadetes bacterium]|nr:polyphosphate kinase 1 [Gemmatimonadota bacterium]